MTFGLTLQCNCHWGIAFVRRQTQLMMQAVAHSRLGPNLPGYRGFEDIHIVIAFCVIAKLVADGVATAKAMLE